MSGLERRGDSKPSRRAREQRAYRMVQVGGAAGLVAVVGAVLAILGVIGWSLTVVRGRSWRCIAAVLFRRTVAR